MGNEELIFRPEDPKLKHLSISVRMDVMEHETYEAKVYDAVDGDTLRVRLLPLGLIDCVRLLGIDTPEIGSDEHAKSQCRYLSVDMDTLHILARLSTLHMQWLCPKGAMLTLKTTGTPRDGNNRILAGVFTGETCINRLMVEHGYALAYQGYSDWESYRDLELQAREARRGIWGSCEEQLYLASSKTYHRPGCSSARYANTRFETIDEARGSGLGPCGNCRPDYCRIQNSTRSAKKGV